MFLDEICEVHKLFILIVYLLYLLQTGFEYLTFWSEYFDKREGNSLKFVARIEESRNVLIGVCSSKSISEILSFNSDETTREARETLGFKGSIQFEEVDANEWRKINTGSDAVTYSEGPPWKHVIKYPNFIPMNEQTALHELTHVILNEIGFRDIEILSKKIIESNPKTVRESAWKKATYYVAEPYAEWIFHRAF